MWPASHALWLLLSCSPSLARSLSFRTFLCPNHTSNSSRSSSHAPEGLRPLPLRGGLPIGTLFDYVGYYNHLSWQKSCQIEVLTKQQNELEHGTIQMTHKSFQLDATEQRIEGRRQIVLPGETAVSLLLRVARYTLHKLTLVYARKRCSAEAIQTSPGESLAAFWDCCQRHTISQCTRTQACMLSDPAPTNLNIESTVPSLADHGIVVDIHRPRGLSMPIERTAWTTFCV